MAHDPTARLYPERDRFTAVLYPLVSTLGVIAVIATIVVVFYTWKTQQSEFFYVTLFLWAVIPPAWFWYEFFFVYRVRGKPRTFELFKHGQQVSAAIWAGVLASLIAIAASEAWKVDLPDNAVATGANVDVFARVIAIIAATAAVGRLIWEVAKHIITGRKIVAHQVRSSDEPRQLIVTSTNHSRRHIFVREARLRYDLGGQELHVVMPNSRGIDGDTKLESHGDAITFTWTVTSDTIMQVRLAFQNDPDSFYITIESTAGIVSTIGNLQIQPILRHVLNEFNPEPPAS